jgi:hypothetical protein
VIGTAATLKSTTIIITIATTISTATSAARDKVIGSTMHNTEAMHPTGTGKRRINSGVRVLVAPAVLVIAQVAPGEPVVREALAELAVQVAREALAELAVQVAQEALAELAVQVAQEALAELELVPVVVDPELGLAVAEPELGRVEVAPEPDHRRAQLAVALRTKSVIAAHHHGLVPVLRAEDLAVAAAETTREPAAPGEVVA